MRVDSEFFRQPLLLTSGFSLPSRAILAPMEGIMNRCAFFHAAVALRLIDSWMPPFLCVSAGAAPGIGTIRHRFAGFIAAGIPLTIQILGNDPDTLVQACRNLYRAGIRSVNLNCGCPSKTVLASGSGGALLKEPGKIRNIIRMIRQQIPEICVSVKLRTGFSDAAEMPAILESLNEAAPHWVILHYRTVREGYDPADRTLAWSRLKMARTVLNPVIPLFANGDIRTPDDAQSCREQTLCDGIAVARGILHDPFLLRKLRNDQTPSSDVRKDFLTLLEAGRPEKHRQDFHLECVKMTYGADSPEFREALRHKIEDSNKSEIRY